VGTLQGTVIIGAPAYRGKRCYEPTFPCDLRCSRMTIYRVVSTLDHTLEPKAGSVRRLEVITGTGRRRRFSDDDTAAIIAETLAPGAVVSDIARRHGLTPQQLFTWRREARRRPVVPVPQAAPALVPAVINETSRKDGGKGGKKAARRRRVNQVSGIIEVETDGVTIRFGSGAVAAQDRLQALVDDEPRADQT
jgi:transposase